MRPLEELLHVAETGDPPSVSWTDPALLDVQKAPAEPSATNDDPC